MKRIGILATAALVSGLVLSNPSGIAANKSTNKKEISEEKSDQQKETTKFIKFSGVIKSVEKDKQTSRFLVENKKESIEMIFPITDNVLLFDNSGEKLKIEKLKKGMQVDAYYDKSKPMTAIYPATITPEIMIANSNEIKPIKISKFDKNFISLDNKLKLNITKDTILLNDHLLKQVDFDMNVHD